MPAISYDTKADDKLSGETFVALVDVIYMPDRKRRTMPRKIPKGATIPPNTLTLADIKAMLTHKHIAVASNSAPAAPEVAETVETAQA